MKNLIIIFLFMLTACTDMCWRGPCFPIPGNTRADGHQQAVVAKGLFVSAHIDLPQCDKKDMQILNTITNNAIPHGCEKDVLKYGLWEETWTIEACGHKFEGIVEFWKDGGVGPGGPRFKEIK